MNGEWRRLHNEEFHSFNRSPIIFKDIKYRRFGWVGYIARMEENGCALNVLIGKSTGRRYSKSDKIQGLGKMNVGKCAIHTIIMVWIAYIQRIEDHRPGMAKLLIMRAIFQNLNFFASRN